MDNWGIIRVKQTKTVNYILSNFEKLKAVLFSADSYWFRPQASFHPTSNYALLSSGDLSSFFTLNSSVSK